MKRKLDEYESPKKKRKQIIVHSSTFKKHFNENPVWRQIKFNEDNPPPTYSHSIVVYQDAIYTFAGYNGNQSNWYNCLYRFSFADGWQKITTENPPPKRAGHVAVVINDEMYVFGGFREEQYLNDTHSFNFKSFCWKCIDDGLGKEKKRPSKRSLGTAVTYNEKMIMFGGFNKFEDNHFNETWEFDPKKEKWRLLKVTGDLPEGRYGHGSCLLFDEDMYIFGGQLPNDLSNDIYSLNLPTNRWKYIQAYGQFPCHTRYFSLVGTFDTFAIFGGEDDSPEEGDDLMNCIFIFDAISNTWKELQVEGEKPPVRCLHPSLRMDNYFIVIGGMGHEKEIPYLNDMWMIDIWKNEDISYFKENLKNNLNNSKNNFIDLVIK